MLKIVRRRRPRRYGHSEICAGVSVATLQTRHRTAGAAGVTALLALIGERSTDAVMILFRAFPVARPELMDVPLLLSGGAPHRRGGSLFAMIERYQPSGRPASQLLFALRAVAPARVRASNGVSCCCQPRGLLGQSVGLLIIRQPTVRRRPLEVSHVAGGFQPLQPAPESGAQRRHLSRRSPCSNSSAALESSQVTGKPSQCDIPTTASSAASSAVSSAHTCSSTNGPLGPCMHPRPRRFGATGMHVNVTSHKVLRQIHAGT